MVSNPNIFVFLKIQYYMGVRYWEITCDDCNNDKLIKFEHLNKDKAISKVNDIVCENCSSNNVYFNGKTSFSGSEPKERKEVLVWCENCTTVGYENYINIINKDMDKLKETFKEFECDNCGCSNNWKISDATGEFRKL